MHDTFRLLDCNDDSNVGLHNYVNKEDMWYLGDIDDDFWNLLHDNLKYPESTSTKEWIESFKSKLIDEQLDFESF